MELFDAIYSRRSVRRFRKDAIPQDVLSGIIDAGRWAPSACNVQGWRFIVVDDPKIKRALVERGAASFLENAPVGILVVYKNQTDNVEYMDYVQSASACIQNMLLAAHSLGIGGCWICHLPRKAEMRKVLKIPFYYDPIAYIALGYPEKEPIRRERLGSLEGLVSRNGFEGRGDRPASALSVAFRRLARKAYYLMPFRKHLSKKADDRFEKRFD